MKLRPARAKDPSRLAPARRSPLAAPGGTRARLNSSSTFTFRDTCQRAVALVAAAGLLFPRALLAIVLGCAAAKAATTNSSDSRLLRPLSITEALDIAAQQNSTILKSKADLEAN